MFIKLLYTIWYIARNWYRLKSKFLTIFGDVRFSVYPMWLMYQPSDYQVTGAAIQRIIDKLQPGDIILRGYDKKFLDNLFIPSKYGYSHAGVYVGNLKVIHAVAQGVSEIHLVDYCQADKICIIRVNGDKWKAIELANKYLGSPYDFSFEPGDNALYCFQLAAMCYPKVKFLRFPLSLFGIQLPKIVGQCYLDKSFIQSDDCEVIDQEPK